MADPNPSVRLAACEELLDRAYGKPPQAITGTDDRPPRILTSGGPFAELPPPIR
jgi:hypothetical protein